VLVMGAAIVRDGRVLAARRTDPHELAGGWEFPGGKVEPGEDPVQAIVREVREELGCTVSVTGSLSGEQPIKRDYVLRVATATLTDGEPVPHEHDAVRWLGPEDLDRVTWLAPDIPFLPELREILLDGRRLDGGNVGGAVRIGRTVRRATGPWTPAVHALLAHLATHGLPLVPRVHGYDARGREILTYLDGHVVDVDHDTLTDTQLAAAATWSRRLHEAVRGFDHPGPWRFFGVDAPDTIAHNDIAPYNLCFHGDRLSGVFDWDLAGPSTRLYELAHLAWNGVPLFRPLDPHRAARRLETIATAYGEYSAAAILAAVPGRVQVAVDGIRTAVANGDEDMRRLTLLGEPEGTERALADLRNRIRSIEKELA
jgi:8-oxo-dGTP diphosphatase